MTELPPEYSVRRSGDLWIVIGPTGVVVLGRAGGDPVADAASLAAVAQELRDLLAEVTTWVPFVEALLVADRERHDLACGVIEPASISLALTVGAPSLDDVELAQLRHALGMVGHRLGGTRRRPLDPA